MARLVRPPILLVLLLLATTPPRLPAQGPTPHPYIGKRVITASGTTLTNGDVVDDEGRSRSLAVSGKARRNFRIYRVDQANGPWLWLIAERGGVRGWAWSANVIPLDEAVDRITAEIRANPASSSLYTRRGNVWGARGELDTAIADYFESIRLDPSNEFAWLSRGIAWGTKKEYDKAIADIGEAIRLDPRDAAAYNSRAWLWATCPDDMFRDGMKAVESATKACELNVWKDAYDLRTLAAAHAEAGAFAKAVEWQGKVNALHGDEADREKGKERLKLYEAKTPYRERD